MRAWLFRFIFKDLIPFKWIDGYKTEIARLAAFISALLVIAVEYFPEYVPMINQSQSFLLMLLSLWGIDIGKQHKELKARVVEEKE